jgi:uracil-DNA glycosylase
MNLVLPCGIEPDIGLRVPQSLLPSPRSLKWIYLHVRRRSREIICGCAYSRMEHSLIDSLRVLHEEINRCRVCESLVFGFVKPPALDRGEPGKIMIVGQGPGRAEAKHKKAFAGQSGKTLDDWLVQCSADRIHPRRRIYFTSVIKCSSETHADYPVMVHNCLRFLHGQLSTIRPELVVTLGREAFE